MFHNDTNQIPVFALNRNHPDNPPPRYTRNADGSRLFNPSTVCLSSFLLVCFLFLLLLVILGQVFILIRLEQMAVTCLMQDSPQSGMSTVKIQKAGIFETIDSDIVAHGPVHSVCLPFAKFT